MALAHVMVGSILSMTVTFWVHEFVFPLPSVTVQVTTLRPRESEAGDYTTEATLQLSAPEGAVS